jgi:hypothetical protein
VTYHIRAVQRDGQWVAFAERTDNGDRFGIEITAATEGDAVEKLTRWMEWQREHTAALEALQSAERAYHRTIAGSAFASAVEGPSPSEMQRESLEAVEAARVRLDEIRVSKPENI